MKSPALCCRLAWLLSLILLRAGTLPAGAQTITNFTPEIGPVGSTVVIAGDNFIPPFTVTFGGNVQAAGNFTETMITVTVPSGAVTGFITVTTALGSASTATVFTVGTAPAHPAFFTGETALDDGVYYLQFPSGTPFGYYSYLSDVDYIYHFDLGYEYVTEANDNQGGVYLYDFASGTFFYTSASYPFPYLYDFTLNTTLYYYPDTTSPGHYTTNPRYFFDFGTGTIITK